jgi:O-antigen ligase/polysaccharide polymerase Wzy-like membrane protein
MYTGYVSRRSVASVPAVVFVASIATFALSLALVKLVFLALFLLAVVVNIGLTRRSLVYPTLIGFYLSMCIVGIVWAIIGLLNPGNSVAGVADALRLYVIWSFAFLVLYSLLRSNSSLGLMHASMVLSGVLIAMINLAGLADQIGGWGLIPENLREDLDLRIGIHEGYIQIASHNIGSLFVIVPYLLSLQFRKDAVRPNTWVTKLTLVMCLILTVVSGRRALWLVVALTPCLILVLSIVTKSHGSIGMGATRLLRAYTVAVVVAVGVIMLRPNSLPEIGYIGHVKAAFSSEDERSIQKAYLLDSFAQSPILGSGFGAHAEYLRNEERPWTYELTYHQLLFNLGIVGLVTLGSLVSLYLVLVASLLRRFKDESAIPFALLVGFCSLLIGAYSNPYFGSFDFLFFVGLLPYLSTFRVGFDQVEPAVRAGS